MTERTAYENRIDALRGIGPLYRKVEDDIAGLGGYLRCEECRRTIEFADGAMALYLQYGWPKCHGYTMRWWTQRQIDAGEAPALAHG